MGYLIEYESHEQEELLLSYLREKYEDEFSFWIGLHDQTSENAFVWDHSNNQVTSFRRFIVPYSIYIFV